MKVSLFLEKNNECFPNFIRKEYVCLKYGEKNP